MGSKSICIGKLQIGGTAPIRVESMLTSSLKDMDSCVEELQGLAKEGCELVRVAFPEERDGPALEELIKISPIPVMGDIHFDAQLALEALRRGCPSIRLNPGNMRHDLAKVIGEAKERHGVLRIGANGGSIGADHLKKARGDRAEALVIAVEEQLALLEKEQFHDVILSAKSTNINQTLRANQILANRYDYPLHIGITEAGFGLSGIVKSACGLSLLLSQGIGDTLRVSLTGSTLEEVKTGYAILRSLELRSFGPSLVSCPTCGRRKIDVATVMETLEPMLQEFPEGLEVAVMGCEVNGPKEAANADIGVAGTPSGAVFFSKGVPVKRVEGQDSETMVRELQKLAQEILEKKKQT